jgi:hypothetical protein
MEASIAASNSSTEETFELRPPNFRRLIFAVVAVRPGSLAGAVVILDDRFATSAPRHPRGTADSLLHRSNGGRYKEASSIIEDVTIVVEAMTFGRG